MRARSLAVLVLAAVTTGTVPSAAAPQVPVPGPTPSVATVAPPGTSPPRAADHAPCTISGTDDNDRLTGTPGPDVLCGGDGDDVLEGLEGDDVLDGGDGDDTATWETSVCCVSADLNGDVATGFLGADFLESIENLTGSQGADVLRGDGESNTLSGLGATDLLYGNDADDLLLGGDGDDYLSSGPGGGVFDGGEGADICGDVIGISCDVPTPVGDPDDTRGIVDVTRVDTVLGLDPATWRIELQRRSPAFRLWDEGYVIVSFDVSGGDEFDKHALVRWNRKHVKAVLIGADARKPSGGLKARRAGKKGILLRVPRERLAIDVERAYYRWSVGGIYTGTRCHPCIDRTPEAGAYPQPLV